MTQSSAIATHASPERHQLPSIKTDPAKAAAQLEIASKRLTECLELVRRTPLQMTLGQTRPDCWKTETLSILKPCQTVGSLQEVGEVVKRLLAHDPSRKPVEETVAQDWALELRDKPLACIWWAYREEIRSAEKWSPSLGQFLQRVRTQETLLDHVIRQVEGGNQ